MLQNNFSWIFLNPKYVFDGILVRISVVVWIQAMQFGENNVFLSWRVARFLGMNCKPKFTRNKGHYEKTHKIVDTLFTDCEQLLVQL